MQHKTILIFVTVLLSGYNLVAQTIKFGAPDQMLRTKTASIEYSLGVLKKNYLVIENDYGNGMNMRGFPMVYVRQYNLNNLGNKGQVYLNEKISEISNPKGVLFLNNFQWKNRLVSFYTKKSSAKSYPAYARMFDSTLKPIGGHIELGDINHGLGTLGELGKPHTDRLRFKDDFWCRFSPDSTAMALIMPARGKGGNLEIRIYDSNLKLIREQTVELTVRNPSMRITDFEVNNGGIVYFITRTKKGRSDRRGERNDDDWFVDMYSIDKSGIVKSADVSASGKSLIYPGFNFDLNGFPTIVCLYHDISKSDDLSLAHGVYVAKYDPVTLKQSFQNSQAFSKEMLLANLEEKFVEKGGGLSPVAFTQTIYRPDGGFYVIGQRTHYQTMERGTTGAMNVTSVSAGKSLISYIDAEGKVKWSQSIFVGIGSNVAGLTSYLGTMCLFRDNKFKILAPADNDLPGNKFKRGVRFISYDDNGLQENGNFYPFPDRFQSYGLVPSSFLQSSPDQYLVCLYQGYERGHKEMEVAVMQVDFR